MEKARSSTVRGIVLFAVVIGLSGAIVRADINDGLVAWWKFDETGGTTAVDSVGGMDGTLVNTPGRVPGGALAFNGTNEYVDLGSPAVLDNLATGDFSISMWIKTTDAGRSILIGNYSGNPSWNFEIHSTPAGSLRLYLDGENHVADVDIANGRWRHVAAVRDLTNSTVKMYVDKELVYSEATTKAGYSVAHSTMIGRDPRSSSHYYKGDMDDVRIHQRALLESDIEELYEFPCLGSLAYGEGNALNLSGTATDYLTTFINGTFSDLPTEAITVEFWMRSNETAKAGTPFSLSTSYRYMGFPPIIETYTNAFLLNDIRSLDVYVNNYHESTGVAFNDGKWHHMAVRWQGNLDQGQNGRYDVYKDGVHVSTLGSIAAGFVGGLYDYSSSWLLQSAFMVLGQDQDSLGGGFQSSQSYRGQLDEVRVWNTFRTQTEIRENMYHDLNGDEPGLVAYYNFNQPPVTTIVNDISGHNNHVVKNGEIDEWLIHSTAPIGTILFNSYSDVSAVWEGMASKASGGLTIDISGAGEDDNCIFGHNNGSGVTSEDCPAGLTRIGRYWYVDQNNQPAADLTFDMSDAAAPEVLGDISGYMLLSRVGSDAFSVEVNGADSRDGDKITFSGVHLQDRTYTLAIEDVYTLSVVRIQGGGSVSMDPPGGAYFPGTEVTLTAVPRNKYHSFDKWTGSVFSSENPITVTVDRDMELGACFTSLEDSGIVYVDRNYGDGNNNDGHEWGVDAFNRIQAGIDASDTFGVVYVAAGVYNENITLSRKRVQVIGAGAEVTTIDGGRRGPVVYANFVNKFTRVEGFTLQNGSGYKPSTMSYGGGLYCYQLGSLTIANCIFYNNTADKGGGVCSIMAEPVITNCTFIGNSATTRGAGIYSQLERRPKVSNCIFWDSPAGGIQEIEYDDTARPAVTYSNVYGGYSGSGNINQDPRFESPGAGDYHLQSDSPCIDRGSNSAEYMGRIDLDGDIRVIDGDGDGVPRVDMGVDEVMRAEYTAPLEVWVDNDFASTDPGTDPDGDGPATSFGYDAFAGIREAIAVTMWPGTVHVLDGSYNEEVFMKDGVSVLGSGAGSCVIDRNYQGRGVTFVNIGSDVIFKGFTITRGDGTVGGGGGGMLLINSEPFILDCIIHSNKARWDGGGMMNQNSDPWILNCRFSNNTVGQDDGEALRGAGMLNQDSTPLLAGCVFYGNRITPGISKGTCFGAAICNSNSSPELKNCTIYGNGASSTFELLYVGGAVYLGSADLVTMSNCILWGNQGGEIIDSFFNVEADNPATYLSLNGFVQYSDIYLESGVYKGSFNINQDPLLENPGGLEFGLQADSPCIDAGNNYSILGLLTNDIEGNPRMFDDPEVVDLGRGTAPIVDMGAVERFFYSVVVVTDEVSDIVGGTAVSGGEITLNLPVTITGRGVCWNTVGGPTISNAHTEDGPGEGAFISTLDGLESDTQYHVRAYATYDGQVVYGDEVMFQTCPGPILNTFDVTAISDTSANCGGEVVLENGSAVTMRGICWNTAGSPTVADSNSVDDSGVDMFGGELTGLARETTYYVRAYGANDCGIGYGNEVNFTTLPEPEDVWVDDDYCDNCDNDGHAWGVDAFDHIQDGIDAIAVWGTVHVAEGEYAENITMTNKVSVIGAGAELTIIDGGGTGSVVYAQGVESITALQGFTLINGTGTNPNDPNDRTITYGGGVFNWYSALQIRHCIFRGNIVTANGGGVFNGFNSAAVISHCKFISNEAGVYGGGISNHGFMYDLHQTPTIANCSFYDNRAGFGGAVGNYDFLALEMIHCTLSGNHADTMGGGIINVNSVPQISNCIVWDNVPSEIDDVSSLTTVIWSDVQGGYGGVDDHNLDVAPLFVGSGDLSLQSESPCIDAGNNSLTPSELSTDLAGFERLVDSDCDGTETVDMGAYEYNPRRRGDCDGDCDIDLGDFALLAIHWLSLDCSTCAGADINGDGQVDLADLTIMVSHWPEK